MELENNKEIKIPQKQIQENQNTNQESQKTDQENLNNKKEQKTENQFEEEYQVEKIVDVKKVNKIKWYLVKWMGWEQTDNTWEPEYNLVPGCEDLILKFTEEQKQKQKEILKQMRLDAIKEKKERQRSMQPHILDPDMTAANYNLNTKRKGKISLGDVPQKVLKMVKNEDLEGIYLEVQWKFNKKDNVQPAKSVVSSNELREYYIDVLIEYYESRIIN